MRMYLYIFIIFTQRKAGFVLACFLNLGPGSGIHSSLNVWTPDSIFSRIDLKKKKFNFFLPFTPRKFLVIEMEIWHVQGFWVVCCWPVLLRLSCAPCSTIVTGNLWPHPRTPALLGKLLVLQSWYCCLQYLVLLKALWGPLSCYLSILGVTDVVCSSEGAQRSRVERTKAVCDSCWDGERWSCTARMELSFSGSEELCLRRWHARSWGDIWLRPGFPSSFLPACSGCDPAVTSLKHRAKNFESHQPALAWQTMVAARLAHTAVVMVLFWEEATKKYPVNHVLLD